MPQVRISLIGAGSGCFALGLIKDICRTAALRGSLLSLVDIDESRLAAVHTMCARYAAEVGADLRLEATIDRRKSLPGADFVINTALAAPHERLREGWQVARRHGYGFAGSYHVCYDEAFWINFYQFRLFDSIIRDTLELCPRAWHLMVANPVISGSTYVGRQYPQAKSVGLCHGYAAVYEVARTIGLDPAAIDFELSGVNHFVWLTRFTCGGADAFPSLDRWIDTAAAGRWRDDPQPYLRALNPKTVDLYKRYGVLPIGDTAHWSGACWPWWYHSDPDEQRRWLERPEGGWDFYFDMVADQVRRYRQASADPETPVSKAFPEDSQEPVVPLIESLAGGPPRRVVANLLNAGQLVPGLPADFAVELHCRADAEGLHGLPARPLPRAIVAHILRDRVAPVELELEAYRTGSRNLLVELILTDWHTRSRRQAESLLDEILAMPYHQEMRAHYR